LSRDFGCVFGINKVSRRTHAKLGQCPLRFQPFFSTVFNKLSGADKEEISIPLGMFQRFRRLSPVGTALLCAAVVVAACSSDGAITPQPSPNPGVADGGADATTQIDASADDGGPMDGSSRDSGDAETGCKEVTPSFAFTPSTLANLTLVARPGIELSGVSQTRVAFEVYAPGDPSMFQPPGTYDLSKAPYDNYGECPLCTVITGLDESGASKRLFAQTAGTIEFKSISFESSPALFEGTLRNVVLHEFTQDPKTEKFNRTPNTECYFIREWKIDTRIINGGACVRAEDCPSTVTQVCDPKTNRCAQASDVGCFLSDPNCPNGFECKSQLEIDLSVGVCLKQCTVNATDCAADESCVVEGIFGKNGFCRKVGPGAIGASCNEPDVTTGCVAGAGCIYDGNGSGTGSCQPGCNYFAADPGCPQGRVCDAAGACVLPKRGRSTAVGSRCPEGTPQASACGADAKRFAGLCIQPFTDLPESTCQRLCAQARPSDTCSANEVCQVFSTNPTIGFCKPKSTCGDGKFDFWSEKCDDGNTIAGDGCNADCTAAEFGPLCAKAEALVLDTDLRRDTNTGSRGYFSSCGQYEITQSKTFSFASSGEGTLEVELFDTGTNEMILTAYEDCANPAATEITCRIPQTGETKIQVKIEAGQLKPTLIAVMGKNIASAGPFTLRARFLRANCGDGQVAGREQCDDGNTIPGDGCSATCKVEWPVLCGDGPNALPLLSTRVVNSGTTLGAPNRTSTEGECTTPQGDLTGSDSLFRYVAPTAGTLALKLSQQTGDQNLFIYGPCGAKTEIHRLCANGASGPMQPETIDPFDLAAGESIVVGVENLFGPEGPFKLDATFIPK
jgi:cysteine-rich repeat protein